MKTLKKAIKEAERKANETHGFVIDNKAMNILLVKVERRYNEYITKKIIGYRLSAEEKAEREKREKRAKEKGLNFE